MSEPFIIEGFLNLESQEGGYAGPDWRVDDSPIFDKVAQHFEVKRKTWNEWKIGDKSAPGDIPIGRVRITIERLEPVQ